MKILNIFTVSSTPIAFFNGQYKYLADKGYDIWLASSSDEPVEFVKANSIKYRRFDIRRSISPFADLRTIATLIGFIRRERFDAVVGHTPKGAMVAMIAALFAGVKTRIYYRHGLIYTTAKGIKRRILKTVEQVTSLFASHIINVSPSLSALAVKDHLNSGKKQRVIGHGTCGGIDTVNTFNPELVSTHRIAELKSSLGISDNDLVIGFCGRICKEKGIRELVDGFKQFRKNHPSSKLLLVGLYDTRDILPDDYKHEIEANPNIILTGWAEKTELPLYYAMMDVFVFPSYREGFGMCVIEASAMKTPVLVSRSHGCIDSIQENETGKYIDITADSISNALEKMKDSEIRNKIGEGGRKFVVDNFDYHVMWPMVAEIYKEIIK